jgi:hypothetical protein
MLHTARPGLASGAVEEGEGDGDVSKEQAGVFHDLAPVHNILVQLPSTLQVKVDLATRKLDRPTREMRQRSLPPSWER